MGTAIFTMQAGGGIWDPCTACTNVVKEAHTEFLVCFDVGDGEFANRSVAPDWSRKSGGGGGGGASGASGAVVRGCRRRQASRQGSSGSRLAQRIQDLTLQLFKVHDLNGNGLLEEEELVGLNERIAKLHNGPDFDTTEVRRTYKQLFRDKFDAEGRAVPFAIFRTYALETLDGVDDDPEAQEMILEQFVAEAQSAAELYDALCPPSGRSGQATSRACSSDFPGPAVADEASSDVVCRESEGAGGVVAAAAALPCRGSQSLAVPATQLEHPLQALRDHSSGFTPTHSPREAEHLPDSPEVFPKVPTEGTVAGKIGLSPEARQQVAERLCVDGDEMRSLRFAGSGGLSGLAAGTESRPPPQKCASFAAAGPAKKSRSRLDAEFCKTTLFC